MNDIDDFLKNNESLINILKDGYNLLETDCIEMRYYITLGTYCDDLCTGIKGVGFSFIKEKIVNKGMKQQQLLKCYAQEGNLKENILYIYLACLIYKPGDTFTDFDMDNRNYINETLNEMPVYCMWFRKCISIKISKY